MATRITKPSRRAGAESDLKLAELCRLYQVSLDLIRRCADSSQLVDAILSEYEKRLLEIPTADFLAEPEQNRNLVEREKVRSLLMFATQAALLKDQVDVRDEIVQKNSVLLAISRDLHRANTRLRELNEHYLNMLSFVAHEFRSPLISILGFAELLAEGYLGAVNAEQRDALQIILRVSRNLIDMTKNYLDLSKIESGELRLRGQRLELKSDVIEPTLVEIGSQFAAHGLTAVAKAGSYQDALHVEGDADLLKVVFSNIFSNAVKYSRENSEIVYNIADFGENFYVSVKNQGCGVTTAQLEEIFQKFAQVGTANAEAPRGSGLGLFNTRCIVAAHGGRVWAESEYGSWFKICLLLPKRLNAGTESASIFAQPDQTPTDRESHSQPEPSPR